MSKFKPFHEFKKPLIGLTPETFLNYIDAQIPAGDMCRLVKEVVFSLDISVIEKKYSITGQKSYHPKLMLSLLFYGYATGVRSSRKLEEKCLRNHNYIYLMECYRPDHRTISDFRKDNIEEVGKYFIDILRIFDKLGYTKVGKIYIDGTKVRANASAKRTKTNEGFERWLSKLEEKIDKILEEVDEIDSREDETMDEKEKEEKERKLSESKNLKQKIKKALEKVKKENASKMNLTDPEAKHMKKGGSKDIRPRYNCQAVLTEEGVIVAGKAVTDGNDCEQLEAMVEKSESNTGKEVEEVATYSGYSSYENYDYLEKKKINGYIPDNNFVENLQFLAKLGNI